MSFGISVGRAIGKVAACAVDGAIVSVGMAGKFGADVVTGSQVGYEEQRVRNRARYEQMLAAKKVELALAAKTQPIAA